MSEASANYFEPTEEEYRNIAQNYLLLKRLVKEKLGYELSYTEADMPYLQICINQGIVQQNQSHIYQGIGYMLGCMIIKKCPGFDWWAVEDEFGRDIVLKYDRFFYQINALHIIEHKMEDGEEIELQYVYDFLIEHFEELAKQYKLN